MLAIFLQVALVINIYTSGTCDQNFLLVAMVSTFVAGCTCEQFVLKYLCA
jgi:hypothetical protein